MSIWEGDQELLKRSGRDESTWVVTHLYMEAMLGISLQLSLSQLAKIVYFSYYCLCFLFDKSRDKGRTGSAWKRRGSRGEREGVGIRWRNGPNNVCTCE
jgi:hypothetical protein